MEIYSASNKDNTAPGASGEVQDHQEHRQDDKEQLQDHFYVGVTLFQEGLRGSTRICLYYFNVPLMPLRLFLRLFQSSFKTPLKLF